ncbi:MAG: hypothetical protein LCH89_00230 [Proteobacteria bacterium]|nr:hypothetical protein [Pseudomonadota bacterium]
MAFDYSVPSIDTPPMGADHPSAFAIQTRRAITLASEGRPIPVDLRTELMEAGIDADAIENTFGA